MILLLLLILFCPLAHADWELYALELPDGSVTVQGLDTTQEDINSVLRKNDYEPVSISRVTEKDIPSKADRKYWKKQGNRIVIDTDKKAEDEAENLAKETRKKQLIKMTDAEYEEAKTLGLVR